MTVARTLTAVRRTLMGLVGLQLTVAVALSLVDSYRRRGKRPTNMTGTADGLLGLANQLTTYYVFDKTRMRDNRFAAFIQDDWRVLPKLSLSLGLRYEAFPTFQIQGNKQTNFDFATGRILVPQESRGWVQSYLGLPGGNLPAGYQYIPGGQVRGENIGLDLSPASALLTLCRTAVCCAEVTASSTRRRAH